MQENREIYDSIDLCSCKHYYLFSKVSPKLSDSFRP